MKLCIPPKLESTLDIYARAVRSVEDWSKIRSVWPKSVVKLLNKSDTNNTPAKRAKLAHALYEAPFRLGTQGPIGLSPTVALAL